jgi:uncharacterized protein YjlB
MSQADVDVVRAYNEPYSGEDVIPLFERMVEAYDRAGVEEVVNVLDPALSAAIHADVEWDMGPAGVNRGYEGLMDYWRDWIALWESYVYEMRSYEDLGEHVLTVVDVRARGRQGIEVGMRVFQAWEVHHGKVIWSAAFNERDEALQAAAARAN